MAMIGDGQDIFWAADEPTTHEGIESYYPHHNVSNNVVGQIKIRIKYSIGKLNWQSTSFKQHLLRSRVHINNVQLGEKEGIIPLGQFGSHISSSATRAT
jgi:hypothetical protein